MGAEKHPLKVGGGGYVGGFLQLFDWNGKSRKKLTYSKLDFPEGTKQGKKSDENLPLTQFHLIEKYEDEGAISSFKPNEYSFATSSTDDEGSGARPPSVVARLMGLDSLPASTEPYATPLCKPRSLQKDCYTRNPSELHHEYRCNMLDSQPNGVNCFRRRSSESRPQKMLNSSPIERFQSETLPRSIKPHQIAHHKLLSPIKSPGFISPKNVAVIMEAAARILEPGYRPSSKGGRSTSTFGSSELRDPKIHSAASYRPSRLSATSKSSTESNAAKYLKGQSLSKSWNGSEDAPNHPDTHNPEENQSAGLKNKGKSVSLAIQAKVNVQRREGLKSSSTRSISIHKDEGHNFNQPSKNQTRCPRNPPNKLSAAKASDVLRQNNQKQNCLNRKDKLPLKPSVSSQQSRKVLSGDVSYGRNKTNTNNKFTGSSRVNRKPGSEMTDLEKEVLLARPKGYPRKKRTKNGDFHSEKFGFVETSLASRDEKSIQPHVAINDQLPNWSEDGRKKGMDVVSFTFSSPMIKSTYAASQSPDRSAENQNTMNDCIVNSIGENSTNASMALNLIGGDALSILLEHKLRELTSGIDSSSSSNSGKIVDDISPTFSTYDGAFPSKKQLPEQDELVCEFSPGSCSIKGHFPKVKPKFQRRRAFDYKTNSDALKEPEIQQPSPVSIFEASFSNESCNSSESLESNGGKMCYSVQAQNLVGSESSYSKKTQTAEVETELLDSACSNSVRRPEREPLVEINVPGEIRMYEQEIEYMRETLHNVKLKFKDLPLSQTSELINSYLIDGLENKKIEQGKDCNLNKKELFDFARGFLNAKCSRYMRCGYKTWAKGVALVQEERLIDEICKEISLWRSMGDWMVDELVDWDMSNHLGRWLDFEVEAFEAGEEIEKDILSTLVNEAVEDMLS